MMTLSFLFLIAATTGQEIERHNQKTVSTSLSTPGRHQIVQSTLAARWTFRLDTFAGRVFQFVKSKDGENLWEEVPVIPKPLPGTSGRYQIVSSGIAAKFTFLLDTASGRTWELASEKDESGAIFQEVLDVPLPRN